MKAYRYLFTFEQEPGSVIQDELAPGLQVSVFTDQDCKEIGTRCVVNISKLRVHPLHPEWLLYLEFYRNLWQVEFDQLYWAFGPVKVKALEYYHDGQWIDCSCNSSLS